MSFTLIKYHIFIQIYSSLTKASAQQFLREAYLQTNRTYKIEIFTKTVSSILDVWLRFKHNFSKGRYSIRHFEKCHKTHSKATIMGSFSVQLQVYFTRMGLRLFLCQFFKTAFALWACLLDWWHKSRKWIFCQYYYIQTSVLTSYFTSLDLLVRI